jgi:hypothetical protein
MNSAELTKRKRKHEEEMARIEREHDGRMKELRKVDDALKNLKKPTGDNWQELIDYGNGVIDAMHKFKEVRERHSESM